jgi:hypothetical protein
LPKEESEAEEKGFIDDLSQRVGETVKNDSSGLINQTPTRIIDFVGA